MILLLERDRPLGLLGDALALAERGEGSTVLLGGEAGIGKTTLVERFAADHAAIRTLWGACEALFTPHPLGPLHDIARSEKGPLKAMLADGTDRAALFAAVLDLLSAPPAPTILVIEDIHWADAATLDLIRYLGRRIHRASVLMVLTYRDDELDAIGLLRLILGHLPSRHATRIVLQRLSPVAVASLASDMARDGTGLYAATGGNPFFVTEVLAHRDGGVPATVRDAVLARAAGLSAAAHEVLQLAAIVPRAIEASLVDCVLAPDPPAIDDCIASGLLQVEGRTLRFRHELARVAIEEAIPRAVARQLHARVLAALTASSTEQAGLARLVHHAQGAEDSAAVLHLAPRAAREAASRGARRDAAAHCRVALAFAQALPDVEHASLLEEYANHAFELNDLAAAIPAREHAIALFERLGDRARASESMALHAMLLVRALRNAEADAVSRRAIEIAQSLPEGPLLAKVYANEAYLRMLNRDFADAEAWGRKAIALAARFDSRETLAVAWLSVGAALLFVDYPQGCESVLISHEIGRTLADGGTAVADSYVMLGTGSGEVWRFDVAEARLAEGIAFARTHDLDRLAGYMEAWQALVDVFRGRWDLAGERAHAVLGREVAGSTNRLVALVALGRLRTRRGDPGIDEALDEALDLARRSGTLQRVAPVQAARAEAAWLRRDAEAVLREAMAAYRLAEAKGHAWYLGELALWRWRVGDLPHAPAGCAAPYAAQIGGRWQAAADAWAALGCPYEQARALADGDESAQRQALALFDRLGAAPMADRLRHAMRDAGVAAIPRGPRESTRSNAAGLTARERQVLTLLARGWANARIAADLSRSTRTVEHHIAAILAKLDVGSRTEAVEVARQRRIL